MLPSATFNPAQGQRALANKNFRLMPGMLTQRWYDGRWIPVRIVDRVVNYTEIAGGEIEVRKPSMTPLIASGHATVDGWFETSALIPDFRDAATRGCLLDLVRAAYDEPRLAVIDQGEGHPHWNVVRWDVEWGTVNVIQGNPTAGVDEVDAL